MVGAPTFHSAVSYAKRVRIKMITNDGTWDRSYWPQPNTRVTKCKVRSLRRGFRLLDRQTRSHIQPEQPIRVDVPKGVA
jgi:hypothetical protein